MKKLVSILLVLVLALTCFAGCGKDGDDTITLKIAYHPHVVGGGAMLLAQEKGYFEAEGLKVELVEFTNGAAELAAMASGEIHVGYIGVGAHVFLPKGQAISLALDSTDFTAELLTRDDTGIKTPADLKGKTIGISAGTTSEMVANLALERGGLTKSDVKFVNLDATGKVTAFLSGQIDAIAIESPFTDNIRNEIGEKAITVISNADFLPENVFTQSWCATSDYVKKNPEAVQKFMNAWVKATQDRYDDIDYACKVTADYLKKDYEIIRQTADKTNFVSMSELKKLVEDETIYSWYDNIVDNFISVGLLGKEFDISSKEFTDFSYFLKACENAGIK